MRRAVIIALVVLVIITGLPVLMHMDGMDGMASCERCDLGIVGGMVCLAVLAGAAMALALRGWTRVRFRPPALRSRLLIALVERPPQYATA